VPLRTVVLNNGNPIGGGSPYFQSKSDEFGLKPPAGTKLRAVLPLSQAKPCYAAGYSEVLQT
jgi:hypothetical protein